jgi:hypothetical protein
MTKINKNLLFKIICSFILFAPIEINAQTSEQIDSSKVKLHSPKKATIMSAVVPGLGQIYNKKYWKAPVIYGGFAILGYFIYTNNDKYQTFRKSYNYRIDGDPLTIDEYSNYTEANLLEIKNYYRKNLELTYIITGFLYIFNIIDACVDAHLFYFDISDDLSLKIEPCIICPKQTYCNNQTTGIKLILNL